MIGLFAPLIVLLGASLISLSSIAFNLFLQQCAWVVFGGMIIIFFGFVDWRPLLNYRWVVGGLYVCAIVLLVVVLFQAPLIRNTKSWLVFGPFTFQPVEFVKVSLIFLYAYYFSRRHLDIARWKHIGMSFLYFALPAGLVMLQPDLGSTLVLFGIWFGFLLVSGLPVRRLVAMIIFFILAAILIWQYVLLPYHKERIIGVFFPERDLLGVNYSAYQSKIAIGSAGFFGKGYGQGTQTQLGFVTEPATDFILAALIEEWGLLGGGIVIGALVFLIVYILRLALRVDRNFEKFICIGTVIVFSWQFFINAGSATGIFPVVGVTFPFLSYGGSNLLTNFFLIAILYSIAKRA